MVRLVTLCSAAVQIIHTFGKPRQIATALGPQPGLEFSEVATDPARCTTRSCVHSRLPERQCVHIAFVECPASCCVDRSLPPSETACRKQTCPGCLQHASICHHTCKARQICSAPGTLPSALCLRSPYVFALASNFNATPYDAGLDKSPATVFAVLKATNELVHQFVVSKGAGGLAVVP